jgi:hypothetical protein
MRGLHVTLVAVLAGLVACSSGERPALTPDGAPFTDSVTDANSESSRADADPCSPYRGGLGIIIKSRLPSGACTAPASCQLETEDACPNHLQWLCDCQAGSWSCTLVGQGKLDCAPDPGGDAGLTSPEAPYCCPRDTVVSGCTHLGGVNEFGCAATCDFWCSTNWRVEIDTFGCERWAMDYRKPGPGENMVCLPQADAGEDSK